MTIYAYIDGASRGNPGESGVGIFLRDEHGKVLHSVGGYIGRATNNIAEYVALIECLKRASKLVSDTEWSGKIMKLIVHSDSELLVRQVQGTYRVKNEGLRGYFRRVHRLLQTLPFAFEIRHLPRELNREADTLANVAIDGKVRLRPLRRVKQKTVQEV